MSQTNDTTRDILSHLFTARVFAWRQNVLPIPIYRAGQAVGFRSGSKQGLPDICGIIPAGLLRSGGQLYGVPLFIEVKTGRDRLRPEQLGFIETARKMGGVVLVVKDFNDFKRQWDELLNK